MTKTRKLLIALMLLIAVLLIPNMVKADEITVTVERNIYAMDGSMKFTFTGLTLDKTHEYEFGLTKTLEGQVEKWFDITEYTENTAVIDVMTTTKELRTVINAVDKGYITIKDKTADKVILQPYEVDLRTPFLNLTNYTVINNGKEFGNGNTNGINIALRCASNSQAYYQYQKITDQNIINKYKEIKSNNGDFNSLQSILTTNIPSSNWTTWLYWNGHDSSNGMNGYGYPESPVNVPDSGLYYLWIYFSGANLKPLYGYILVDNLQPDIAVESISLPTTKTVELGKTLTLTPTVNPEAATNKNVTWKSSDETVATVDNTGKVTPKKVGSTNITVTTQDGNKTATCKVTVTEKVKDDIKEENDKKTFKNHTYQIINKNMTWEEAKKHCESLGGYLLTITSKEEQEFIESYIKEKEFTENSFWLGATDKDKEGTWKWITGEKFDYSNWGDGEPDNKSEQDYLVLESRKVTRRYL